METKDYRCARCGSIMKQTGSEHGKVIYHCNSCGYNDFVALANDDNSDYWQKRAELLARVRKGIFDWQTTNWEYLRKDIVDFTGRYDAARYDMYFKMALIACVTDGFHDLNSEKYKQCKMIFKVTEKIYKSYLKDPEAKAHFEKETGNSGVIEYEEYREMYKRCRSEYRNTKIFWKAFSMIAKKLVPIPKL